MVNTSSGSVRNSQDHLGLPTCIPSCCTDLCPALTPQYLTFSSLFFLCLAFCLLSACAEVGAGSACLTSVRPNVNQDQKLTLPTGLVQGRLGLIQRRCSLSSELLGASGAACSLEKTGTINEWPLLPRFQDWPILCSHLFVPCSVAFPRFEPFDKVSDHQSFPFYPSSWFNRI